MRRPRVAISARVATDVRQAMQDNPPRRPQGGSVVVARPCTTMTSAYQQLFVVLALAIVLIYLLIVVNFKSWLDPFGGHPGIADRFSPASSGSCSQPGTTLSVPALTGAIMCMGCRHREQHPGDRLRPRTHGCGCWTRSHRARRRAAPVIRPVLMTALAMVIGMVPMAHRTGQNTPLRPGGDWRADIRHLSHLIPRANCVQPRTMAAARKPIEASPPGPRPAQPPPDPLE